MDDRDEDEVRPRYSFRPSLMGAAREFELGPDEIHWNVGRFSGKIPYRAVTRVRLSFKPVTMQSQRYLAEVWAPGMPKLMISSTTWKNMVEQGRQDEGYSAFVRAMHERISAAGGTPQYVRGVPVYLYWPGIVVFALISLGLIGLIVKGVQSASFGGAAFVAGFFGLFLWQVAPFFRRNVPGTYSAGALPAELIPK